MRDPPTKYSNLRDAMNYISSKFDIPLPKWVKTSKLLYELLHQTRIDEFRS